MSELEVREARAVSGVPVVGIDCPYYTVDSQNGHYAYATRITVTCDLPGMYCSMERVRVYRGDDVIWEGPLHNLQGVSYFTSEELAARGERS